MASVLRDIRLSIRSLARSPLFTTVAVISLALGIGANSAIFTMLDQVLLRLLPVHDPESLVMVVSRGSHVGNNSGTDVISYPMFKDYREKNKVFDGMFLRFGAVVNFSQGNGTDRVEAELVSGDFFEVLGIRPAAGRLFTRADETSPGADPLAVLSYDFWEDRFGRDAGVIGQRILINNSPLTVVGVAAPGFRGVRLGFLPEVYVPITMQKTATPDWDRLEDRRSRWANAFGRLKPGVSPEQADAAMKVLYQQIIQEEVKQPAFDHASAYTREQFLKSYAEVIPAGQGFSTLRRQLEKPLLILMALVGLVLLISCANVSNLLVARGTTRQRELAIQRALGAGRRAIVRLLLIESLVLALVGSVLALGVSIATTRGILLLAPTEQARIAISPELGTRLLLFNLGVAIGAALLFGLLPAIRLSSGDVLTPLKEQSGSVASRRGVGLRKALVTIQVSLSLLLLMGSALFIQSLQNLRDVHPGFQASHLIRFKLDPMLSGYDVVKTKLFFEDFQKRVEALPGVESAAFAVVAIMEGDRWDSTVSIEGYQAADGENMNPHFNSVSPHYFRTLGIPLTEGTDFDEHLGREGRPAIIVNRTFANKYFGDKSPLGYHMGFGVGQNAKLNLEIIGVVEDTKYEDLRKEPPRQVFVSYRQNDWATEMTGYVKSSIPSSEMFAAVQRTLKEMDSTIPLFDMVTMEDQFDRSLAIERLIAYLSGAFAFLATLLAVVGLYGVTAYGVTRRQREIGIRIALGAENRNIVGMILREVLLLSGLGVGVALPLGWWLLQYVQSQLYGVEARDPLSVSLAAGGLLLVALISGALPAHRAASLAPSRILRYE